MAVKFFVFPVEALQFSKFHGNKAKYDKRNFKRFDRRIQGQKIVKLMEKFG